MVFDETILTLSAGVQAGEVGPFNLIQPSFPAQIDPYKKRTIKTRQTIKIQ